MVNKQDKVLEKLYKKAIGYDIEEVVEEYSGDEGGGELVKRKITKKPIPPDVTALKTYIEITENKSEFESMTDDELVIEKMRLIGELEIDKGKQTANVNNKTRQLKNKSEV